MDTIFNAEIISMLANFVLGIGVVAALWAMGRNADEVGYDAFDDDPYMIDINTNWK